MHYLLVTHLDRVDQAAVEERLAAVGLAGRIIDDVACNHELPPGTYAGLFEGSSARSLRNAMAPRIRAAAGPGARVAIAVGRHCGLRVV